MPRRNKDREIEHAELEIKYFDRILRPERFAADPDSQTVEGEWKHWFLTFENYLEEAAVLPDDKRLKVLFNHISPKLYEIISDCSTYEQVITSLKGVFIN